MAAAGHHLIGRDEELARISRALGRGGSVLLRGDAGIGKTALLQAHAPPTGSVTVTGAGDLPLSAFAHLGDAEWHQPTPAAIAAALYRTTIRNGADLLIVDDAHWLDPASAGLVLQLARSGTPVLAAARTGHSLPRALQAVLRQGGETIEVQDLSVDHVRGLMEQQLEAPVSLAFAAAVAAKTGGNPLYVREVVSRIRAAGGATVRHGVWALSGPMPLLDVRDLLSERIERLPNRVRFALELLAVAGDLPLSELLAAVGEETVTAGETDGVIRVTAGVARPGHPLQRDATLSLLPAARRARVHETLLHVAHRDEGTPGGAARRALWRIEGGIRVETDELLDQAERVYSSSQQLSRRLAGAATAQVDRASRPDQAVRLGGLWVSLGDGDAADRMLDATTTVFPPGLDTVALGLRGFAAWIVHDRPADALELLETGISEIGGGPMVDSQRTAALWRLGRIADAERVGERLAVDEGSPADARAGAAATLHTIAAMRLDPVSVDHRRNLVRSILSTSDRILSEGRGTFEITVAGRRVLFEEDLDWAESSLRDTFTAALERGEEQEAAQYGWMLGWSLALRGRPRDAVETMPEFLELGGPWAVVNGGWASPAYVRALVAAGETGAARHELDRMQAAPLFSPEIGLAEVDVLAAEGRRPAAIERARHHRGVALEIGNEFRAVSLAWAGVLLGSHEALRPMIALCDRSEVPLHDALGAVAHAIADRDLGRAVAGAQALRAFGHRWHAVEAVSLAASLPPGSDAGHRSLRALYEELTDGQPQIRTRATPPSFGGADLTAREREVAALAAQGLSDRAIAERLVLSVRTVETHIAHVFAKTGLHRRDDLDGIL